MSTETSAAAPPYHVGSGNCQQEEPSGFEPLTMRKSRPYGDCVPKNIHCAVEGPMSRDFEFKQLLRAYRSGIINEAAFEQEVSRLEGGGTSSLNGGSFRAMGKDFPSERAAVMSFLESTATGEAGGAEAFTNWTAVCQTDCIRSGLRMVAEREAYHSRQLAQRLRELGGECKTQMGGTGRKFVEFVSDPNRP